MGKNPSKFKGDNRPVENVSWNDAVKFCQKLSKNTGKQYTLPSESQWEYASGVAGVLDQCFYFEPVRPSIPLKSFGSYKIPINDLVNWNNWSLD